MLLSLSFPGESHFYSPPWEEEPGASCFTHWHLWHFGDRSFPEPCPLLSEIFIYFLKLGVGRVSLLSSTDKPPLLTDSPHPLAPQGLMSSPWKFSCTKQKANCLLDADINPATSTFQPHTSAIPRAEHTEPGKALGKAATSMVYSTFQVKLFHANPPHP